MMIERSTYPERAEAAKHFRSDKPVRPFNPNASDAREEECPADPQKSRHFGYLARIIDPVMIAAEKVLTDDNQDLAEVSSPYQLSAFLNDTYLGAYEAQKKAALQNMAEWPYLTASHVDRVRRLRHAVRTKTLDSVMVNGIHFGTVSVMPILFEGLVDTFGTEKAAWPGNWQMLNDNAKLNPNQSAAFASHYLTDRFAQLCRIVREQRSNDGIRYLKYTSAFPAGVPIRKEYARISHTPVNLRKNHADLGDITSFGPTIGCPVTFTPKHVEFLWSFYTRQWVRIYEAAGKPSLWERQRDRVKAEARTGRWS